jgi:hypothetical protein
MWLLAQQHYVQNIHDLKLFCFLNSSLTHTNGELVCQPCLQCLVSLILTDTCVSTMDHVHPRVDLKRIKHNAERKQHCWCFSLC